jgi:3-deoxy-D-manno-octulosonic-acid transferase
MIRFVYNLTAWAAALYFMPRAILRGIFADKADLEQLGIYPRSKETGNSKSIWIHCASVGEVKIASELIDAMCEIDESVRIVLTVKTRAGKREAHRLLPQEIEIRYCPYDLRFFIARAIRHFNPEKLVLIETEIWPNLIRVAASSGIRLYLVNGRISGQSFEHYRKLGKFLADLLGKFSRFMMQSDEDKERLITLGAERDRCEVVDNIKYDIMRRKIAEISAKEVRQELGIDQSEEILIAGSTRGGEEKFILEQFAKLKRKYLNLKMIIAPRHLQRVSDVESFVRESGLTYTRRSVIIENFSEIGKDVMILDAMGELASVYSVGEAAFVGGSLVPKGGQNPLEPVGLGVPTCFGPHMDNFERIVATLKELNLAHHVKDSEGVHEFFDKVLSGKIERPDPTKLFQRFGRAAEFSAKKVLKD